MPAQRNLPRLSSIVAIDLRGAIGCDNALPWRLKTDMAFFREKTLNNTVIMGRKTYESLGSKPLPRRNNIVLSHNNVLFEAVPNCQLALSLNEALFRAAMLGDNEAYVIGGAQTYAQFDRFIERYLITVVDHQVPNADAFLSQRVLASLREWDRVEIGSYPSVSGQDEYAFSIFEVEAPDVDHRRVAQQRMVDRYSEKIASKKPLRRFERKQVAMKQNAFSF